MQDTVAVQPVDSQTMKNSRHLVGGRAFYKISVTQYNKDNLTVDPLIARGHMDCHC